MKAITVVSGDAALNAAIRADRSDFRGADVRVEDGPAVGSGTNSLTFPTPAYFEALEQANSIRS